MIGSNIANILLMIGTVGVIYPFVCGDRALRRDGVVLLISTIAFVILCHNGVITLWHGVIMFSLLIGYLAYCYISDRRNFANDDSIHAGS